MVVMECFNNFTILAWNIRGAFGRERKRHIRDLVRLHHPSIFVVFETHGLFAKAAKSWSSLHYKPLIIHEAFGSSPPGMISGFSSSQYVLGYHLLYKSEE